jgi:hypothetical protein
MSAGGLSYSGLTSYGKATLPSVEGGLGSLNILRDPPKSITTRRIDKVNEASQITQMIQDSGDRACEAITQYARGVNPSVSVSYQNYGNNGGARSGSICNPAIQINQARLPYAIGSGGNYFRPPVRRQENLLPLSRLPRVWTSAFTNKEFPDFQMKMLCPQGADKTKEVHTDTLRVSARPTCTYKLESPLVEPFEVKYMIKRDEDMMHIPARSGYRTRDLTQQEVKIPLKGIDKTPMHNTIVANSSDPILRKNESEMNTKRYIQDTHHSAVQSKVSNIMQTTPIGEIMDLDIHTKDLHNISYTAPYSSTKAEEYMHKDISLQRRVPNHQATTNRRENIYKNIIDDPYQIDLERNIPNGQFVSNVGSNTIPGDNMGLTSRNYKLTPTLNPGAFMNSGTHPTTNRAGGDYGNIDPLKSQLNKRVADQFDGRYRHGFVRPDVPVAVHGQA